MPVKKKITRHVETIGENGCVEFFPKVKKFEDNYDCINGTWALKTGSVASCNPKSKLASDKWNYSYICNPYTGRYRHIPGTPSVPRKPRKSVKGVKRGKRGPSAFNMFFSEVIKRPEFQAMADGKARFAAAMATAKVEWKSVTQGQKAQYTALAAAKKAAGPKAAKSTDSLRDRQRRELSGRDEISAEEGEQMEELGFGEAREPRHLGKPKPRRQEKMVMPLPGTDQDIERVFGQKPLSRRW